MEIVTPLGEDVLLFHGMYAREEMGRLFEYQLDLLSTKDDVNLDKILGENVTVKLGLPEAATRYFNGYVTRFAQTGMYGRYRRYVATVRPWLWFLTRTSDCRIFQDMTVPDIVKAVFADHPIADFKSELTGSYRKWTYCVQYRETDFNFVSRLLEEEGIYYYFKHTDGHDTMVLADSTSKHKPEEGYEKLPYVAPDEAVRPELEHVSSWEFGREIQPGVYVHDDYDLERPSAELKTSKTLARTYKLSDYEVYDYPGNYLQTGDGEQYAEVRIDELGSQFEVATGATNARGLSVGALLTLEDYPRDDQNREYLVLGANYDLKFSDYESLPQGGETSYRCTFAAMSSKQQFRPKRITPKPFVQGPQTAMVVGPAGDEIYTDKFGRVKVKFHWDRDPKKDENSSCWIRVSHPWAGKGWGAVATPRIGQEVIVDFLEGDPDQPIITGRVYNAESEPPFGFPAGAVLSGIKSQTHKGGGYNELSMDDTAGAEKITIHGQFDMNSTIEHDQTLTVHNNRTDTVDVDDSETIGNNQTWKVGVTRDATIGSNEILKVGANRTKNVGSSETVTVGENQGISVVGNQNLTVGGNQSIGVSGSKTETITIAKALSIGAAYQVSVGAAMNESIGAVKMEEIGGAKIVGVGAYSSESVAISKSVNAGKNISESAGADVSISAGKKFGAKAGSDLSATAGGAMSLKSTKDFSAQSDAKGAVVAKDELVLECGKAKIILKSGGQIEIEGTAITVNGSEAINVTAKGDLNLKGKNVNQNCS
jgi:type VI secretion system secreted protein VgrG